MITVEFKLKDFDGPLDLLLALIGKAQIDIRDIFISDITDQYLALVRNTEDLNMDEASDFLVMAATLLEIKSRAMLPKPPPVEEGEEDPEEALIRRLEEYKRFRETAEELNGFEAAARKRVTKRPEEYPLPPPNIEITGLTLEKLLKAYRRVLERAERNDADDRMASREIRRDSFTVAGCMARISRMVRKGNCTFFQLFGDDYTRQEVVTMFMALLELIKLNRLHVKQDSAYEDIVLSA